MTTQNLAPALRVDEGFRLQAYPDPISGGAPWTIGFGHTGPEVHPGLVWTQDQAEAQLAADIAHAEAALDRAIPWWRSLSDVRQDVLANMAFNLGVARLLEFKGALAAMKAGDFVTASAEMLNSRWAREVVHRAQRLAEQMRTGIDQFRGELAHVA